VTEQRADNVQVQKTTFIKKLQFGLMIPESQINCEESIKYNLTVDNVVLLIESESI